MPRIWITDGSLPVFSDTERLSTSHRGFLGLPVRYEGFVDPDVALGASEIFGDRPDDALFAEAEWCVLLDDPLTEPDDSTPIVLQGLIEGKWMNRLLGTKAWRPASIANNVLAAGRGIPTTLGALEDATGETRLTYDLGEGRTQEHVTTIADLVGENVPELVREVVRIHAEPARVRDVLLGVAPVGAQQPVHRQQREPLLRDRLLELLGRDPVGMQLVEQLAPRLAGALVRQLVQQAFGFPVHEAGDGTARGAVGELQAC